MQDCQAERDEQEIQGSQGGISRAEAAQRRQDPDVTRGAVRRRPENVERQTRVVSFEVRTIGMGEPSLESEVIAQIQERYFIK